MLAIEPEIVEAYVRSGQVQLVFRPILNHGERSLRTSEAAFCAGEQDQFWAMHDLLFERLDAVWRTPENSLIAAMTEYAVELGLDQDRFANCIAQGEALALVQQLDAEQREQGISLQPTFQINDVRLIGFQPFDVFQDVIESMQ